jgi:hypothetical protein
VSALSCILHPSQTLSFFLGVTAIKGLALFFGQNIKAVVKIFFIKKRKKVNCCVVLGFTSVW